MALCYHGILGEEILFCFQLSSLERVREALSELLAVTFCHRDQSNLPPDKLTKTTKNSRARMFDVFLSFFFSSVITLHDKREYYKKISFWETYWGNSQRKTKKSIPTSRYSVNLSWEEGKLNSLSACRSQMSGWCLSSMTGCPAISLSFCGPEVSQNQIRNMLYCK